MVFTVNLLKFCHVLGIDFRTLCGISHFMFPETLEVNTFIPTLQMRKLRYEEIK